MPRQLRYIAQPFTAGRPGPLYPFVCALDAEAGGKILAASSDGVLVFQQWIDPDAMIFGEPEVLASWGDVPSAAICIDGDDGREDWMHHAA